MISAVNYASTFSAYGRHFRAVYRIFFTVGVDLKSHVAGSVAGILLPTSHAVLSLRSAY